MKSDVLAPVLAAMSPDAAQKLTVKLANKLALPDTAGHRPRRSGRCRQPPRPANRCPATAPAATAAAAPAPPRRLAPNRTGGWTGVVFQRFTKG